MLFGHKIPVAELTRLEASTITSTLKWVLRPRCTWKLCWTVSCGNPGSFCFFFQHVFFFNVFFSSGCECCFFFFEIYTPPWNMTYFLKVDAWFRWNVIFRGVCWFNRLEKRLSLDSSFIFLGILEPGKSWQPKGTLLQHTLDPFRPMWWFVLSLKSYPGCL